MSLLGGAMAPELGRPLASELARAALCATELSSVFNFVLSLSLPLFARLVRIS